MCAEAVGGLGAPLSRHRPVISTFPVISLPANPTQMEGVSPVPALESNVGGGPRHTNLSRLENVQHIDHWWSSCIKSSRQQMEVAEAPKQMAVTSHLVLRQISLSTGTTELGEGVFSCFLKNCRCFSEGPGDGHTGRQVCI